MRLPVPLGLETNPSRHPPAGAQFLMNMRAEITRADSKATVPIALFRNEGITSWLTGLAGAVRGMHEMQGVLYVVAGTNLYRVTSVPAATDIGDIAGTGAVDMADNGTQIVIVNAAGTGFIWNESTDVLSTITDPDFPTVAWVEFLDQFFVFGRLDGDGFLLSALADPTSYDALDVASPESNPDDLVMGKVVNRDLLLFGTDSLEIWYNAGLADFPLDRAPDGTVEIGCAAKSSVAVCDNAGTWLGRYRGGLSVRRLEGRTPRRISTPSLDDLFDSFTTVDDAIGQSYTFGGHEFYMLIFPTEERTFCWDATTNLWHERSYEYPGDLISSFVPSDSDGDGFDDGGDWTGDDGFTVAGGVATFVGGTIIAMSPNSLGSQRVVWTSDGKTWFDITGTKPGLVSSTAVAWSETLGQFLCLRQLGTNSGLSFTSTDGNSWSAGVANNLHLIDCLTYVDAWGLWIAGGDDAVDPFNTIAYSADGLAWTYVEPTGLAAQEVPADFAYNPTGGVLVAVTHTNLPSVFKSTNGTAWTRFTCNQFADCAVWADSLGLFVKIGGESTGTVETSPDGETWTDRFHLDTLGFGGAGAAYDLAWSGTTLCVVCNLGTTRVATSTDAVNWTARSISAHAWNTVHWFQGVFAAVADQEVAWSADGATWTDGAIPAELDADDLLSVAAIGSGIITPASFTNNVVHFAAPGRRYTSTVQVNASNPSFGGRVGMTFYDSMGAVISTTYAAAFVEGTTATSTVTAEAPAGAVGVSISIQANGPAVFDSATIAEAIGIGSIEWRANSVEFAYGKVLVGDGLDGRIGFLDRDAHKEFAYPIPWVTTSSPITKDRRLLTFNRLEIEIDAGRSTTSGRVWMQWSDDDGRTWSKAKPRSMGASGKYKTRLAWHNLGSARSRIFRVFGDDPSPTAIVAAYADVTMGH